MATKPKSAEDCQREAVIVNVTTDSLTGASSPQGVIMDVQNGGGEST